MVMGKETPYRHGGWRAEDPAGLRLGEKTILDFSVNLNALGPPPLVREQWDRLFPGIVDYPGLEGEGLGLYYQERYGIPPQEFLAGNGSSEMIYLIPRVLGFKRALVTAPSFHDYERATLLAGGTTVRLSLLHGDELHIPDANEILGKMGSADALWLGNPNNPTGNLFPRETILEICTRSPGKWVIVDEAFIPFVDGWEAHSLLSVKRPRNLLVLHSLTKFYALAGIRMGGVVGDEEVIARLRACKEPWTVNGIAERVTPLLLQCGDYERETLSLLRMARGRLLEGFSRINGVRTIASPAANFILCRWGLTDVLDDLLQHLLSGGIYVRDCRNFPGLQENWFRVAVRRPGENDRLLSAIASFSGRNHA
jgi:threonine-phosphate decarboxylase